MRRPTFAILQLALTAAIAAQDPPPPAAEAQPPAAAPGPKLPPEQRPEFDYTNATGQHPYVEAFGVLARDPRTGDLGLIVISSAPGVGGFAVAGSATTGIAATAGIVDPLWAGRALELLAQHGSPSVAIEKLHAETSKSGVDRQMLVLLASDGQSAFHRGANVLGVDAGTTVRPAPDWVAFGAYVASGDTLDGLVAAGKEHEDLPLPERLLLAVQKAHDGSPKDKTGVIRTVTSRAASAVLLVVRKGGGRLGRTDRLVDLRVDFDPDPIDRLRGVYHVWTSAHLAPTLRALQRETDPGSPAWKADLEWMRRMRAGRKLGEK